MTGRCPFRDVAALFNTEFTEEDPDVSPIRCETVNFIRASLTGCRVRPKNSKSGIAWVVAPSSYAFCEQQKQDLISQRTRAKQSLSELKIEDLESTPCVSIPSSFAHCAECLPAGEDEEEPGPMAAAEAAPLEIPDEAKGAARPQPQPLQSLLEMDFKDDDVGVAVLSKTVV
jgi:hypothetical protein